jgi:hypothetical protein
MKCTGIHLPGFRLDNNGRLVREARKLDVSARFRQKASKRVRVVRQKSPANAGQRRR